MTAYESIVKKLSALSIYNLESDGLLEAELRAYAIGLQFLYDDIENILKECFIQTAENEGLENLELMTRTYSNGDTIDKRREKLLTRLSIKPTDMNKDGIEKFAASMVLECEIVENPKISHIYIDILTDVPASKRDFITSELVRFAPPHLVTYVRFNDD